MKLDITEEELIWKSKCAGATFKDQPYYDDVIRALKELGIKFKQEIDWEAETHDPSVIPDKWLVERWDDEEDKERSLAFFHKGVIIEWAFYRAIKKEDWPKWAIKQHKTLEYWNGK